METDINAILIHEDDNVATVTTALERGSMLAFRKGDDIIEIKVVENIPVFHKVAISDFEKGTPVFKYGQLIGKACSLISRGSHVHDHNIESSID